jgi:hypothetical protein
MTTMTAHLRALLAGAAIAAAPALTPVAASAQEFINVLTGGTSGV